MDWEGYSPTREYSQAETEKLPPLKVEKALAVNETYGSEVMPWLGRVY